MPLRDPRTRSQTHLQPRSGDPTGSRSYGDATDIAVDAFRTLAKEQLIPVIANRTRNAISVDGRQIFFYQRLRSGNRCSCWSTTESTPQQGCPICFNTGFVGGYHKWGTELYLFEPTSRWWGVNVTLNPLIGLPPWFALQDGTTSGYLEWSWDLYRAAYYGLDTTRFEYRRNGGEISLKMMLVGSDPDWVPYSENALKERLLVAQAGRLRFRVTLRRATPTDVSPLFLFFMFRALTLSAEPPVLVIDIPRRNENNQLAEYGVLELFTPIQMAFSDEIQRINLEDLVVRLHDMTRWKIIETSPNDPQNILTSHDCQAIKLLPHQPQWSVPI